MSKTNNGAKLGFENQLWASADKLRGHMDASEYKHVVLGLIFLKYISDAFQAKYKQLEATKNTEYTDPEDRDEYSATNIFWVPKEARWIKLQASAKQPTIGKLVDDAMVAIEKENPKLKGVLPKDYARPSLDKYRLGELIDIISKIVFGDEDSRSKDILGRVYEYFLGRFAAAEGKGGGEFYTPQCIVKLLIRMIEPYKGRVYDPCCGSGGMFVQSKRFVEEHGGRLGDIAIYGQESNPTTWRLAMMNLAIRGLDANLGGQHADSFHNDLHKDLRADFIIANPPFNMSDWGGERLREDARWKHGIPSVNNANYAWIQHFIHHLSPTGIAGFVMANGSMSSNTSSEGEVRRSIIKADLIDCMISLPGQLFYSTPIPVCLWFLTREKNLISHRDRRGKVLFIDARRFGRMVDRAHRELTQNELSRIVETYHAWKGISSYEDYRDIHGFCRSVSNEVIASRYFDLTPGRYVGSNITPEDRETKLGRLDSTTKAAKVSCVAALELQNMVLHSLRNYQKLVDNCVAKMNVHSTEGILGDICTSSRVSSSPFDSPKQEFQLYSIPAFDIGGGPEQILGKEILSNKLCIDQECVLVSKLNPRKHRVWLVRPHTEYAICSMEFAVLIPKEPSYLDYLYMYCKSCEFQANLIAHATGSTGSRQRVKVRDVLSSPIIVPSCEVAEEISRLVKPVHHLIETVTHEVGSLQEYLKSVFNVLIDSQTATHDQ